MGAFKHRWLLFSLNWDIIMKNLFVIPGKTEELSGLTTLTTNLKANVPVSLREGASDTFCDKLMLAITAINLEL